MGAEVADVDGRNYEGAEVADGEEAVGAPAVVLHPDENFCIGLHISSPNLRLCPPVKFILGLDLHQTHEQLDTPRQIRDKSSDKVDFANELL